MEGVTKPTEIARSATACKETLDRHASNEHAWIRSAQVDFNLWCSAIKATSFDKSGLDYRLRNYSDARESICDLLDALRTSVEAAVRIYEGTVEELEDEKLDLDDSADDVPELADENDVEVPGWQGELEDSDSAQGSDEVQSASTKSKVPFNEDSESVEDSASSHSGSTSTNNSVLEEYISYVRTILEQLTRISLTIRRAGAKYRFERADKALKETEEVKAFRQHLTTIINSGFPDKEAEGLSATEKMKRVYDDSKFSPVQLKLIRANILRRHRIEYFTKARAPKFRAPVEVPKELQLEEPDKTSVVVDIAPPTSIVSSEQVESQPVTPIVYQTQEPGVERTRSIYTAAVTATDVGPNFDTADLSANKAPSRITMVTKIGGTQAYPRCPKPQPNGALVCPFCSDKLPESYAKNEQSWKAHVAQDILPYSCIMEECSNDDEMYLKADQLLAHMKVKHSSTKWICNSCTANTNQPSESNQSDPPALLFFDSAESWKAHTEKEHGDLGPASQQDILAELSERQIIGSLECPLCKSEPTEPSTGFDAHILKHLHEFALRALPGDVGPTNEKESTAFQVSSNASLLSYTKDEWTADVETPDDSIEHSIVRERLAYLVRALELFEPALSEQARTLRRYLEKEVPTSVYELQLYDPPIVNLPQLCNNFRARYEALPDVTPEMKQGILDATIERLADIEDNKKAKNLPLLETIQYPINLPLPTPNTDLDCIEDIAERIDTGLINGTNLTSHCNKYKNRPMPLGEEFRKPTKDSVELVRQLSLLPNIILTGHDLENITNSTVQLVNELKERVENLSILWVNARSVGSIKESCSQIFENITGDHIYSEDELVGQYAKELFYYLSWTYEGVWMMVFDGLEAEGALYLRSENLLPRSCNGTLLISTTDPTSAQLLGTAEVIQIPEVDASSFDGDQDDDDHFQEQARLIVQYCFSDAWRSLQDHLAKSLVMRRSKFWRRMRHQEKLSTRRNPEESQRSVKHAEELFARSQQPDPLYAEGNHVSDPQKEPALPSTFVLGSRDRPSWLDSTVARHHLRQGPAPSVISRGFSFRLPSVVYPDKPKFAYGDKECACPYCHRLLSTIRLEKEPKYWQKHLDEDVEPYVCLSEECTSPMMFFSRMEDWANHMKTVHSSRWNCTIHTSTWYCDINHGSKILFYNRESLVQHLKDPAKHEGREPLSNLEIHTLSRNNEEIHARDDEYCCPICEVVPSDLQPVITTGDPDEIRHRLYKHIAAHIKGFAFKFIPALGDAEPSEYKQSEIDDGDTRIGVGLARSYNSSLDGLETNLDFSDNPDRGSVGVEDEPYNEDFYKVDRLPTLWDNPEFVKFWEVVVTVDPGADVILEHFAPAQRQRDQALGELKESFPLAKSPASNRAAEEENSEQGSADNLLAVLHKHRPDLFSGPSTNMEEPGLKEETVTQDWNFGTDQESSVASEMEASPVTFPSKGEKKESERLTDVEKSEQIELLQDAAIGSSQLQESTQLPATEDQPVTPQPETPARVDDNGSKYVSKKEKKKRKKVKQSVTVDEATAFPRISVPDDEEKRAANNTKPKEEEKKELAEASSASSQGRVFASDVYKILWRAVSLFEFNISITKHEAGYPWLTYQTDEIFEVIAEKGEVWLAKKEDDPSDQVGWIWRNHFTTIRRPPSSRSSCSGA